MFNRTSFVTGSYSLYEYRYTLLLFNRLKRQENLWKCLFTLFVHKLTLINKKFDQFLFFRKPIISDPYNSKRTNIYLKYESHVQNSYRYTTIIILLKSLSHYDREIHKLFQVSQLSTCIISFVLLESQFMLVWWVCSCRELPHVSQLNSNY